MKYFSINELTRSNTATYYNIANIPTQQQQQNLMALVNNVLDPLREAYGKPIQINSGFRSAQLNKRVGGATGSQHTKGEAADITAGSPLENKKLFYLVQELGLPYDQLIDESNYRWIHISHRHTGNRGQILHL